MNCYEADITLDVPIINEKDEYDTEAVTRINKGIRDFNRENHEKQFAFICRASSKQLTFALIINNSEAAENILKQVMDLSKINGYISLINEITINRLALLSRYNRREFQFSISELTPYNVFKFIDEFKYNEKITSSYTIEDLSASAKMGLYDVDFISELQRIQKGSVISNVKGNPVHYIIKGYSGREICDRLISVLYENGRIFTKRYSFLFQDILDMRKECVSMMFKTSRYGTVVIDLVSMKHLEENEHCVSDYLTDYLYETIRNNCNNTQVIFLLPPKLENTNVKIKENLNDITFIEIKERLVKDNEARATLQAYCDRDNLESDENLMKQIAFDTGYNSNDLKKIYNCWYSNNLKTKVYPQYSEFIKNVKKIENKLIGNASDTLSKMIGLENVKTIINQAVTYSKVHKALAYRGMPNAKRSMHMVFTGNPGTAKTTVARLFAQILKDNDVLSEGQLIECGRSDLVGKYVGWTADQVKKKFKQAKGSVLFIDEAYSLVDDKRGLYGDEAINTIVQEMENNREDMVVIFAGYPNEMEEFIERNPGLKSRISFYVNFDNYNTDELCKISKLIAESNGYRLADDVINILKPIFDKAILSDDFGNGRFARNLIERAQLAQAVRLSEIDPDTLSGDDIVTLCAEDFSEIEISVQNTKSNNKRAIGFISD